MFRPSANAGLQQALEMGRKYYAEQSTGLSPDLFVHETSMEVLEQAIANNGFIGGRVIDDIELKEDWNRHRKKRVIFMVPVSNYETQHIVASVMAIPSYAEYSAVNHYLWTKLGLDFDKGKLLGIGSFKDDEHRPGRPTWANLIRESRAGGRYADPVRLQLIEDLTQKFGAAKIQRWIRTARSRDGVVILFEKSVMKIPTFSSERMDDHEHIILDSPLPLHHVHAIIPTGEFAAAKLKKLSDKIGSR